ncbi:MAG: GIY-YIG nuclease family protein [Patescibacteria group bacterium]|nr:GIY-YIG nuclease family protein [Patescibacteria group bacterium]MDD5490393.1 GIY-YIG nuclease family protein [Patescibacteria group bacterium]
MYYIYILHIEGIKGKNFYIGYTADLKNRLKEHLLGRVRTTRGRNPKLIYFEAYGGKYLALKREKGLKNSGSVYNALLRRLSLK